jgi:hypothetical protein
MQSAALPGWRSHDRIEHHADPKAAAGIAGLFVEPEQSGIERRRSPQREVAAFQIQAAAMMPG